MACYYVFDRPHHRAIAGVLQSIDSDFMLDCKCWFGGGTAISLLLGEYRESVDMDFLCADREGYRKIRQLVHNNSFGQLFTKPVNILRDVRTDATAIRTIIGVGDVKIKFEIVNEVRIDLHGDLHESLGVPVLDKISLFAEKLLANGDRFADRAVRSRDILDLGMMISRWGAIPATAIKLAESAYGDHIIKSFKKAVAMLEDDAWLHTCAEDMDIAQDQAIALRNILLSNSIMSPH